MGRPGEEFFLMQGNEACARAAIDAGLRFFAGYPITPATEIAEYLAEWLPASGGVFMQMEDELSCMAAVIGASLAGAKAMTATSGPGFTLLQENLGYAVIAEVPCVVVCVQRAGPSTGLATLPAQGDVMQGRWGTHGDHPAIALAPATVEEVYMLTVRAFNLAERFRTPVVLFSDATLGHLRERVRLPAPGSVPLVSRAKPACSPSEFIPYMPLENGVPPMAALGDGYRYYISGTYRDEAGISITTDHEAASRVLRRIHDKVFQHRDEIDLLEQWLMDDAEIAVVCYGIVARPAKQAIEVARAHGIKVGLVRLISLWPFPDEALEASLSKVRHIIVSEMNLGQIRYEVERVAKGRVPVHFLGVVGGRLVSPGEILERIMEVSGSEA